MQVHMDDTCIGIKAVAQLGIADFRDNLPRYGGVVDLRLRCHLAKDVQLVFGAGHFAGNTRIRVSHQQLIQNLICHLIANLVRMAAGHRFRCKQQLGHSTASCPYFSPIIAKSTYRYHGGKAGFLQILKKQQVLRKFA